MPTALPHRAEQIAMVATAFSSKKKLEQKLKFI